MDSKVETRPFSVGDAGQIFELLQDVSAFQVPLEKVTELAEIFAELETARGYVATKGRRIIGFGSVFFCDRIRGGRFAIVEDMVIAQDMRGRGIGRMLLSELLQCAREKGCFKVTLETSNAANGFYRASGFQDGGRAMKLFL